MSVHSIMSGATKPLRRTPDSPLDKAFFKSCRFYSHDPRRPSPTSLDLILQLGNHFGTGINKPKLRLILRKCRQCKNYMYSDNRVFHVCGSDTFIDVRNPAFHMVAAFLATFQHRGFSQDDLLCLLRECKDCKKICLNRRVFFHCCSAPR